MQQKVIDAKRAKAEELAKKMEVNKSPFGTLSGNKNTVSSPTVEEKVVDKGNKPVENGNQSVDAAANEEHSQNETGDDQKHYSGILYDICVDLDTLKIYCKIKK